MNTFIISDIHGCNKAFRKALKFIRLKKSDTLILLGDLIDRGLDSKGVLDTALLLKENNFNVRCVLGNHEQMMINSISDFAKRMYWMNNGGNKTLKSFNTQNFNQIPKKYINLLLSFERYVEVDKYIFVHAGLDMRENDPFEKDFPLLWMKEWGDNYVSGWLKGRVIIHGHSPLSKHEIMGQFLDADEFICINNGANLLKPSFGNVCVLHLESQKFHFEKVEK